jgi:hypothetical protein
MELDVKKELLILCLPIKMMWRLTGRLKNSMKMRRISLKDWAALSLQESRMTLESSLLDENQVIISTGLGGKAKKLRYFAVIAAKRRENFSEFATAPGNKRARIHY